MIRSPGIRAFPTIADIRKTHRLNALFPIPAPLSDDQINRMTAEEASAAMGQVSGAMNRSELTDADRQRLEREFNLLADRSVAGNPPATPDR